MNQTERKAEHQSCIHPVILAVPEKDRHLTGRDRVANLSNLARQALAMSAEKSNIRMGDLLKNNDGVPLPFGGQYWSLTHKPKYVGAVISRQETGIDIEEVKPVSDAMFRRVGGDNEWRLAPDDSLKTFFRYWTAKEAVLKVVGIGMSGLSRCTVVQITDRQHIALTYEDRSFLVEQLYFDGHIAAVIQNDFEIAWSIEK
jgi:4'-phosphopantetheinyl transferase